MRGSCSTRPCPRTLRPREAARGGARALAGVALALFAVGAPGCGREVAPPAAPSSTMLEALTPRIEMREAEGAPRGGDAESLFSRSRAALRECSAGSGGLLRIRIRSDERSARMTIEEGSLVDAAARRCVLEALSVADFPEVVAESPASTQPRVFASLVTVSW